MREICRKFFLPQLTLIYVESILFKLKNLRDSRDLREKINEICWKFFLPQMTLIYAESILFKLNNLRDSRDLREKYYPANFAELVNLNYQIIIELRFILFLFYDRK